MSLAPNLVVQAHVYVGLLSDDRRARCKDRFQGAMPTGSFAQA